MHHFREVIKPDGMRLNVFLINMSCLDDEVEQSVEQRDVRAYFGGEVNVGLFRRRISVAPLGPATDGNVAGS